MGTVIGTIAGAGIGLATGNPWLGATIGGAIGGGYDQLQTGYSNANAVYANGMHNYNSSLAAGQYNAEVLRATGNLNARLSLLGGEAVASASEGLAEYNAELRRMIGDYNASLLEQDAELIWDAADLDIYQYDRQQRSVRGTTRAAYGASGVRLDEPTDTPSQVLLDMETEAELEKLIIKYNADVQASRVLNAASLSRWQGEAEARQILFEGFSTANLSRLQGALGAAGELASTELAAQNVLWSSSAEAGNILREATFARDQYRQSGRQAFMDGLFTGMTFYAGYKLKTAKPKTKKEPKTYAPLRSPLGPGSSLLFESEQ